MSYEARAVLCSTGELRRLLRELPRQALAQRFAVRRELERRALREQARTAPRL